MESYRSRPPSAFGAVVKSQPAADGIMCVMHISGSELSRRVAPEVIAHVSAQVWHEVADFSAEVWEEIDIATNAYLRTIKRSQKVRTSSIASSLADPPSS